MLRVLVLIVGAVQLGLIQSLATDEPDQELLSAFVVHRHGERTPDADELSLSNEKERLQPYIDAHDFEGLTNVGKSRMYKLGKFVRQRYGPEGFGLLSAMYHKDDIYLRSTDKERTKMAAEIVMAAVYPPEREQQWDDEEGLGVIWQPVPYVTVPLGEDYLRYYSNCRRFKNLMDRAKQAAVQHELQPFADLVDIIHAQTGRNFTENPTMFQTLFDLFKSQVALGLDAPEWAVPHMSRLAEAGRLGYRIYFANQEMKKIGGGVMLNNFVQLANDIIAGKTVKQRFRIFSSHDYNVGVLAEVLGITEREWIVPEYGAMMALEFYKSKSTGKYSVQVVYLPQAGETEAEALHWDSCPDTTYCDYNLMLRNSATYLLPERQYYQMCGIRTEQGY